MDAFPCNGREPLEFDGGSSPSQGQLRGAARTTEGKVQRRGWQMLVAAGSIRKGNVSGGGVFCGQSMTG